MSLWLLAWLIPASLSTLDNDYVRISQDEAPCASAQAPECGDRVIVALGDIELTADGSTRKLARGDIAVFARDASYSTPVRRQLLRSRHQTQPSSGAIANRDHCRRPQYAALRWSRSFSCSKKSLRRGRRGRGTAIASAW